MKKILLAALIISAQFGKSAGMNNEEFDEFIRKTLYENVGAPHHQIKHQNSNQQ